jgi:hypothetical protein
MTQQALLPEEFRMKSPVNKVALTQALIYLKAEVSCEKSGLPSQALTPVNFASDRGNLKLTGTENRRPDRDGFCL